MQNMRTETTVRQVTELKTPPLWMRKAMAGSIITAIKELREITRNHKGESIELREAKVIVENFCKGVVTFTEVVDKDE